MLFDECFPAVFAFAWGCLRSKQAATDVVVDAFARVLPDEAESDAAGVKIAVLREACRRVSEAGSPTNEEMLRSLVFDAGLRLEEAARVLGLPTAAARRSLMTQLRSLSRPRA